MEKSWVGPVTPHIYGKNDSPFRKMGHVTIVNSDIEGT
jgi:5-(carboxyamino)imidazole ribonucleotide synthase